MLKRPDQGRLPSEGTPIPPSDSELTGEGESRAGQAIRGSPPAAATARDVEPDRPYTLRLNKVVMRDFENWVRARGKRKKPIIEAALREYMARHDAD